MTRLTIATRPIAAPLLAAILLSACTGGGGAAPGASATSAASTPSAPAASPAASSAVSPDRPSASPVGQQIPITPSASPVTGEVPADIMARVRAQLATKVGDAAAARATVEVSQAVTWPDGSLGCPQPGMMYTQMVVPGYQVVLSLDGTKYDYRIGMGGLPSLCDSRLPHASPPAPPS